jgi:serine/threonine protein kinase
MMLHPLRSPLGWLHPLGLIYDGSQAQVWAVARDDGAQAALKRQPRARVSRATLEVHARLAHPAIVPLLAHWTDDDHTYGLMPLYAANAHQQPPSLGRAAAWLAQLTEALLALHAAGWAHCDVWPGNVLIDADGQPALADFDRATPFGQCAGAASPLYASPERLLMNAPVKEACDVYSLGVIFHQWLAGRHPYAHLPAAQAIRHVVEAALPPVDPRYDDLIAAMTHKSIHERPNLREVLSRLKN